MWQRLYIELFEHPRMQDLKNVTFETNTTQKLHPDFKNYLESQDRFAVTWSCPQTILFVENLGKLLYCPILLVNITVLTAVIHPKFVRY